VAYGQDTSQEGMLAKSTRGTNAYMLFYERDTLYDEEDRPIEKILQGLKTSTSNIQEFTSEKIMTENFEYYLKRVFFDNTYADFVIEKTQLVGHDQLYTSKNEEILHLAFISFLILLVRKKHKDRIPQMYTLLVSVLKNSLEISIWFINNASNEEFFQEFFIDCLVIDMKAFIYGLISQAIETIMNQVKDLSDTATMEGSQLTTEDVLSSNLEPLPQEGKVKEVNIQPIKNYLLLVIDTIRKHQDKEKFLHHLYRVVDDCSKYASLREMMSQLQVPEHLLYLMHFQEAATHNKLDGESQVIVYDSVFKGYCESELPERKMMSIDDINWEKKGELRSKSDFRVNFSPLVSAMCRILSDKRADHALTCETIVKGKLWPTLLSHCISNDARREVVQLVHEMSKDDIAETVEIFKVIEITLTSAEASAIDLKGNLYLLKFIVNRLDKENSKKKVISLLQDCEASEPNGVLVGSGKARVFRLCFVIFTSNDEIELHFL
jgi:hypothetical protein